MLGAGIVVVEAAETSESSEEEGTAVRRLGNENRDRSGLSTKASRKERPEKGEERGGDLSSPDAGGYGFMPGAEAAAGASSMVLEAGSATPVGDGGRQMGEDQTAQLPIGAP